MRNPIKKRLFPSLPLVVENDEPKATTGEDEDMVSNDFDSGSKDDMDTICNMISVFPLEYDTITEVTKVSVGWLKKWKLTNLYVTML